MSELEKGRLSNETLVEMSLRLQEMFMRASKKHEASYVHNDPSYSSQSSPQNFAIENRKAMSGLTTALLAVNAEIEKRLEEEGNNPQALDKPIPAHPLKRQN